MANANARLSKAAEESQHQIDSHKHLLNKTTRFAGGVDIPGFVHVPAGSYVHSGSSAVWGGMYEVENQNADHKRHIDEHNRGQCFTVSVPYDFYISETYVTNGQYRAFVQAQGYETIVERYQTGYSVDARGRWEQGGSHSWRCLPWEPSDDLPVVQVSWADAMEYAAWLGGQLGAPVRLPTADEWGLAVHPGSSLTDMRLFPWGNSLDGIDRRLNFVDRSAGEYAWAHMQYCDGYKYVNPVSAFPPSERGLYDAVGNVWGWTITTLRQQRRREDDTQSVPRIPFVGDNTDMIMTGGCFLSRLVHCTTVGRMNHPAVDGSLDVGFRLVVVPQEYFGYSGAR